MRIELEEDNGVDDFVVVGEGEYRMRVGAANVVNGADGRVSWMLRMELVDGDMAGRTAVLDWLNFDPRGMRRARFVLEALGFDVSGPLEVDAHELIGRKACVRIMTEETQRETDQRTQRRSRITYDGGSPFDPGSGGEPVEVAERSGSGSSGGSFAADEMAF